MRFVIQRHSDKNEHFDLMIELKDSDKLLTLKISPSDLDFLLKGKNIKAERLPDHRKEYLDYEGPVSGERGSVEIFDSGDCRTVLLIEDRCEFVLSGKMLTGKMIASNAGNKVYNLQFFPDK